MAEYKKPNKLKPLKDKSPQAPSKQSWLLIEGRPSALAHGNCDKPRKKRQLNG